VIKNLENINNSSDLKKLSLEELSPLAKEIRDFIIDVVSVKKGHLGASLGVVELTLALHYVFDTPNDILVWDVGHQAYPHKILTGRRDLFAVIGDASIASGMAFEGLNHAGVTNSNLLIILNDNEMGIDPNVGALKNYLTSVKMGMDAHQKNIFEALNFSYSGPFDGHDIKGLIKELTRLKTVQGPKFLHIITTKGKGLSKAEKDQITYHAPGKFDKLSGELLKDESDKGLPPKFQDVFGITLVELAEKNEKIIGITPAMPTGSSMKFMIDKFPERAFDVGIAEQHAVTLAAGIATQGMLPFCTIYSTFLQRAYDQIIHDVALQNLPVVFCIDRSGLVGEDGATHHGVFDMVFLRCIPNLIVYAPMDEIELRNMMYTVQLKLENPIAIRYPRGRGSNKEWKKEFETIEMGKGRMISEGKDLAILTIGSMGEKVKSIAKKRPDLNFSHFDMRFVKPLDAALLDHIFSNYNKIITVEDGVVLGGFGSGVLEYWNSKDDRQLKIVCLGIPDAFVEHGNIDQLYESIDLDENGILEKIDWILNNKFY